ncbi:GIY-YIG nuclease family protein [Tolypothrix sp. VBCCA 56010]|uniref:GIY-YIG nuclease family protein n=1 Tax=Tolypothrix sp. VBCCA 56010 TaxID=3137731 RepID=UPI003D7EACAA
MIPATSILNVKDYWEHFLPYLPEATGVYMLTIGKFRYIGTSINIKNRVRQHLYALTTNTHTKLMQHAFRFHGFVGAIVLEVCDYKDCLRREAYWILRLCPELNEIQPQDATECDMSQNPNQRLYQYTCFPDRDSEITYQEYIWQEKRRRVNARYDRLSAKYGLAFHKGKSKHPMCAPSTKQEQYYSSWGLAWRSWNVFVCGETAQSVELQDRLRIEPILYWDVAFNGEYNLHTKKGMYTYQHKQCMGEFPPSILYYDGTEERRANADALVADRKLLSEALRSITRRIGWDGGKEDRLCFPHAAIAYVDQVFFPSLERVRQERLTKIQQMLDNVKSALFKVSPEDVLNIYQGDYPESLNVSDLLEIAKGKPDFNIDESKIVGKKARAA